MKHLFIVIQLRSGEDEFDQKMVAEVENGQDAEEYGRTYVSDFWGDSNDFGNGWVEYPNGIIGRLKRVDVITKEEYDILSKYI